jgi:hypothetical protein
MKIFKKIRIKYYILIGLISVSLNFTNAQNTCEKTVAFDNMETWDWAGVWWTTTSLGNGGASTWASNSSVSPTLSAVIYGAGNGNSAFEQDWYVLPNIQNLNPNKQYQLRFRLASYMFTSNNNTRGVDAGDFVEVQVSTDGGANYRSEIRVTGFSNAFWDYNANGVIEKTANNTLTVYTPSAGGNRTNTGDGFSVIKLNLPLGITQLTVDLFCRVNSAGEEWWIDNIELVEINPIEIETQLVNGDLVWNGSKNQDLLDKDNWWVFNGGNYTTSTVPPNSTKNVVIPKVQACVQNSPNLQTNTLEVKDILIELDAEISLGGGWLYVYNDWKNSGIVDFEESTVTFIGSVDDDTLFNPSTNNEFYNLIVNKSSGELVLQNNIKISNELSIEQGNFRLNQKIIDLDQTGFITSEGDGHRAYCDCPSAYIRKMVNIPANTTTNPGNLGLTITTTNKQMGESVIKRRHQRVEELNGIYRIFDVTPQFNGNLNLTLEFQYFTTEVEDLSLQSTFAIYRSTDDGGNWNEEGGFNMIDDKTVIITGWNEFSWITVAPSQNGSALPVELLEFKATLVNNIVELNWTTVTEINNEKFEIERSINGTDFTKIGEKQGANNSTSTNHYKYSDEYLPNSDIVYYRLKQIDFDGKFEYSKIVSVFLNQKLIIEYFNLLGQRIQIPYNGVYIKVIKSNNYIISTSLIKN